MNLRLGGGTHVGTGSCGHPETFLPGWGGLMVLVAAPIKLLGGGAGHLSKHCSPCSLGENHTGADRSREYRGKNANFWNPKLGKKHIAHTHYLRKCPCLILKSKLQTNRQNICFHSWVQLGCPHWFVATSSFYSLTPKICESSLPFALQTWDPLCLPIWGPDL